MNVTNVRLIWIREIRDQLRDRRMIFTVAILPLLLYPLIGLAFLQITQFLREHPTRVHLVGVDVLPESPSLLTGDRFSAALCPPSEHNLLDLTVSSLHSEFTDLAAARAAAERDIAERSYDAAIVFPADFSRIGTAASEKSAAITRNAGNHTVSWGQIAAGVPAPEIFLNSANDKSRIAARRLERVLWRWREAIVRQNLQTQGVPVTSIEPFTIADVDVSDKLQRRAAVWSKMLPFVLLIWAMTGAFYPAVDLCAGEKERGTLETLLSSPADRTEIVCGKLLTVMTFSIFTSLLNLGSMGLTGTVIVHQIGSALETNLDWGPPPAAAVVWLVVALLPISALFSALALAIASFARSSKEGQNYLMPLLLVTFPLMLLPMLPSVELDLGMSLVPIAGMMLWLRSLIEGHYGDVLRFALPVLGVTIGCSWLAVRWAVAQFNSESILFCESERVDLRTWLRHLARDRQDTPTIAEAFLCGVGLLLLTFFASLQFSSPSHWSQFVPVALQTQVGLIALPVAIMAVMLTRSPTRTLLLHRPPAFSVPAATIMAVVLHPVLTGLGDWIEYIYPMSEEMAGILAPIMQGIREAPLGYVLLIVALLPAVCEELAFRGFILSGLRRLGNNSAAIAISSIFFGLTHGMLQQSLAAVVIGMVIGFIAVRTNSLWPGVAFHFTHNAASVLTARIDAELLNSLPVFRLFFAENQNELLPFTYHGLWVLYSLITGTLLVVWFVRKTWSNGETSLEAESLEAASLETLPETPLDAVVIEQVPVTQ